MCVCLRSEVFQFRNTRFTHFMLRRKVINLALCVLKAPFILIAPFNCLFYEKISSFDLPFLCIELFRPVGHILFRLNSIDSFPCECVNTFEKCTEMFCGWMMQSMRNAKGTYRRSMRTVYARCHVVIASSESKSIIFGFWNDVNSDNIIAHIVQQCDFSWSLFCTTFFFQNNQRRSWSFFSW